MSFVVDPYDGSAHKVADTVHETNRPERSRLLAPNGQPLKYETPKVGFDLRPTEGKSRG